MLYGVTGTDSSLQFCSSMQWRQVIVKNMQKCPQNFLPPPVFFAESVLMWTSRMRKFAVACCLALHRAQLSFSDACCAPNLLCSCLPGRSTAPYLTMQPPAPACCATHQQEARRYWDVCSIEMAAVTAVLLPNEWTDLSVFAQQDL